MRRLGRWVRRVTAAALGPVLAASGAVLPAVPAAAVAAGAVAAATAASVAAAPPAKAATGAPVLVLVQNGASSAPEATLLAAAGYTVTQVTPATWVGMSQAQFTQYAALVIGDPSSGGSCSSLTPTTGSSGSDALGTAWQPAVTGNVAVLGTAPVQPGSTAANTLITGSVGYAAAGFNSANSSGTGLYVSLNCEYSSASAPADVSLLDGVDGIGGVGGLDVQGGLSCTDPGTVNTWETARAGTFAGFTSSSLSVSAWGSACPVDEAFTKWPAMFTPAAYDAASDAADNFTASDGATGQPYVLLGTPVSAATAALAPSAGGEVLGGTTAGGTTNPAAPGVRQGSAGDPVNTEDGAFTQSYTDVSLPGFGPSLNFTRSYDSTQAEKQTQAGTPGPMGYGWIDNWATSLSAAEPTPGNIYAAEGLRTGNGNGGDAVGSVARTPDGITIDGAGNAYFADTGDNRIQEIPAVSGPQWGVDMIAGNVYTVAGQADGQSEEPLDGGLADGIPALQAVLHQPQGVAVDPSGDLFIADTNTCRILEVQPTGDNGTGVISTFAGSLGNCQYGGDGGPATAAALNHPTSIHFGQASGQTRDLYIADSGDNRIREVPASNETLWGYTGGMQAGDIYTVAGTGTAGHSAENQQARNSQLSNPQGVTLNGGVMYIADTGNCRIAVVPQNAGTYFNVSVPAANELATVSGRAGQCGIGNDNKQATQSDLENPTAVRDPNGNLYITDSGQGRVQKVASTGIVTTSASSFNLPSDLWIDGSGVIYVADTGNDVIQEVPTGSSFSQVFAGGSFFTLATTGNGGPAVAAGLKNPAAVASDAHGDVFIADSGNNRVQEIAAYAHTQFGIPMLGGDVYTVAGNQYGNGGYGGDGGAATGSNAFLSNPVGVAVDQGGSLYIADEGNAVVRRVDASTADISTFAGTPDATGPFSGNGTAATSATLGNPAAVAVDTGGNVFIADSANNEVLEVPATGGSHYGISGMTAGDIYVIAGASSVPTPPAAPTGLTVTGTTSSTVSLSWTAPAGTVTGYEVFEQSGLFGNTLVASPTTTSVTITGLNPSSSHTYFVEAVNNAGAGPASSTVTATTAAAGVPGAPTGLTVTGTTSSTVSLSWTAPTGTVTGYKVFENGSSTPLSTGVSISGTTATVSGLTASTTYTFRVAATNSAGTGAQSSSVSATTAASGGGVPGAPTGLTVTGTTGTTVSLSWTAPSGTVTGYQVFENGSSTPLSTGVSISGTTATVSGLTRSTTYTFAVAAVNAAGTGPKSNSVSATTGVFLRPGAKPAVRLLATADPSGNSGDGGPAIAALLNDPSGLAVDTAGNVYVSDSGNNQVREIANATGGQWGQSMTASDIYTVAGLQSGAAGSSGTPDGDGGPATAATLSGPQQVALDAAGDLYIADTNSNRVREMVGANGTQWSQSMTAGDIYTAAGTTGNASAASAFTQEDGGPAQAAGLWAPYGIGTDPYGDLFVLQQGLSHVVSQLQEVAATGTSSIPPAAGQVSSLYPLTTTSGGITITQPDGSQVSFQAQAPGGGCAASYVSSGQYCTLPEFPGATLTSNNGLTWTYSPTPGADTYTYSQTRSPDGTYPLISETDPAGNTLTITYQSPAPGTGRCPTAASSCETITAASGRTLVIGRDASGRVTSVTDPLSRSWSYAYSGGQLASATGPVTGQTTSYGYGQSTSNPLLANALTTITGPNAQPGGPNAGHATVNAYDTLGRVTSQTDPMGFKTTFNYCVNAAAGDCMNPATGTGYVTVTDPDGNTTVDSYDDGTLAAETHFTTGTLTTERDYAPITSADVASGGTLLNASATDGDGNTTVFSYDGNGNITSTTAPSPDGPIVQTAQYTGQGQDACDASAQAATACSPSQTGPVPVSPGGVISPPASPPPAGVTYSLYDTNGNQLYSTAGVYLPGSSTAAYSQTAYQLFRGNSVTLSGTTVSCTHTPPSPSLPCAVINADGVVTQFAYDSAGDLASSSTPDGNGSQQALTTYAYDADGEQTSATKPDGNLPGANAGNYTTVTAYNADGTQSSVTEAGGPGATVTPRATNYGYDADGNQTSVQDARGYTTHNAFNADDRVTLVTNPDGKASLTCYNGDGYAVQKVPPAGVAANALSAASCPASYPYGYSNRLAAEATVSTLDATGHRIQQTTPAPAGQSGFETTTFSYDGDGNLVKTVAPPTISGGQSEVTVDTYNSAGQLAEETTGSGTATSSTTSYCYDPNGDQTAVVAPNGNTSGVAPCETSFPWRVNAASYPSQAAYQSISSYDSEGERISVTTPATAVAPGGATTSVTYDPVGNVLTSSDPAGITTTSTYSPQNQVTSISYSGSSAPPVSYTYDASGDRTGMTDGTGATSDVFDPFGELTSATNGAGKVTGYAYTADGQVSSITYPLPPGAGWVTSDAVSYGYDNADQLNAVTDFNGNTVSITNNDDGLPSSAVLGSTGDTLGNSYDATDSVSAVTLANSGSTLQSFTYSDAPDGNILSEADVPSSPRSPASYTYDGQSRVTSMTPSTGSSLSYAFDASGNLLTLPGGASGTYDHASELTSATLSGGTTNFTYDADGGQLAASQAGTTVAAGSWNGARDLTAYSDSAANMTIAAYDGDGLRASATITPPGGTATSQAYVWDTVPQIPVLLMDSGNAYIYFSGNAPSEQVSLSSGTVTYLVADSLGSVRGTVNSSGVLTGTTSYDAWGNPATAGGLTSTTPFGYAGGYTDPSGLIYLIGRYYNPTLGQFISVDPMLDGGTRPYAYASDNPVSVNDPSGNMPSVIPVGGGGGTSAGSGSGSSTKSTSWKNFPLWNSQHAAAVAVSALDIMGQMGTRGYTFTEVLMRLKLGLAIRFASKKKSLLVGYADITFQEKNGIIDVWEVKTKSYGIEASNEAQWYVGWMKIGGHRARTGFDLSQTLYMPYMGGKLLGGAGRFKPGWVRVWSFPRGGSGGILYEQVSGPPRGYFPDPHAPFHLIVNWDVVGAVAAALLGIAASLGGSGRAGALSPA